MKNLQKPPRKSPKKSPRTNLKRQLKDRLSGAVKIAVLGVGSELCGDDAAGMVLARELEKIFPAAEFGDKVMILAGSTAPENFTGDIKRFGPTHLIMVDCADMGIAPGETAILDPDKVGGISFSTHRMPVSIMLRYLKLFVDCQTLIIGIQPRSLKFGSSLSKEVEETVSELTGTICGILGTCGRER